MSRFKPASVEELARRGLNPAGMPLKKAASKPVMAKKPALKKTASKKKD